jgi:hypothetical protein
MRLNPPTKFVWYISMLLGLAGVILYFMELLPDYNVWMIIVAWILLILATVLKGL